MDADYIKRVSWEDVGAYLNAIVERVDPHDFNGVYGIPRGGSVLAAWLSHKLYLPLLSELSTNCIIVDDISDSGTTLGEYLDKYSDTINEDCFVTVMYLRKNVSRNSVDFFYREKEDHWIVFPWEQ